MDEMLLSTRGIKDEADARVVGALVALARTMKMDVIADGIETARKRAIFAARGCAQRQGRYFAQTPAGDGQTGSRDGSISTEE